MSKEARCLFVVAGPSGSGKTTIYKRLFKEEKGVEFCVSATTRKPREGEMDGKDYSFLSREEFLRLREKGAFVEWSEVHDNLYGTLKQELINKSADGRTCVLDVDVQGARALREANLEATFLFIVPPSIEILEQRLRSRGTEDEATIRLRIQNAAKELEAAPLFDYVIVNDQLEEAYHKVRALIVK